LSKGLLENITEVFKAQVPPWACELTPKHIIVAGVNGHRTAITAKTATALPGGLVRSSYAEANIADAESLRSITRQALSQTGFTGSEIVVVVPDDTSRIAFLAAEKPSKNLEEQNTFIRWRLKKTVPFDVDSAQIAFRILGPQRGGTGVDILVALSPRSVVEEYENLFDSLDIHAGMVLPSTLAVLNLFHPPAGDSLFLKVAPDCVTTTVFQDRRIHFYRRVTDVSLYDAAYPTVMYYQDKLGGSGLQHLFVCGYDSDLGPPLNEVQEKLGLSPERVEPVSIDDVFKPALGSVHLAWQNLI
jgi:type IV pilus assembly protein PilM